MKTQETVPNPKDILALPLAMGQMMAEHTKKMMALNVEYFKSVEKARREMAQQTYESMNHLFPGENKIWDSQRQMMEQGFKILDQWAQVWK